MFTQIDRPVKHLTAQMPVFATQERVKGHGPASEKKDYYQIKKRPKRGSLQHRPAKISVVKKGHLSALLYNIREGLKQNQVFTYEFRSSWLCTVFNPHLLQKLFFYCYGAFHHGNPESCFCTNKSLYFTRRNGYSAYSIPDSVEESTELNLPRSRPFLKSITYENFARHCLKK